MIKSLALVLLAVFIIPVHAGEWEEVTYDSDDNIRVWTRHVKGSDMKAFRGVTVLESSVTAPIALLQDVSRAHEWVFNCKAMDLIEELSPTNAVYYTVTSMPWPVKNRDSISETTITQNPDTGAVLVTMSARNDVFPANEDHIRVTEFEGIWLIEPLEGNDIRVTYEAHADPGGALPSWLVNSFVVEAPLNTLREFRKVVTEDQYQQASRSYITP